jgi:hypothetical protein
VLTRILLHTNPNTPQASELGKAPEAMAVAEQFAALKL